MLLMNWRLLFCTVREKILSFDLFKKNEKCMVLNWKIKSNVAIILRYSHLSFFCLLKGRKGLPKTNIASFLHMIVSVWKAFTNHISKYQNVVLYVIFHTLMYTRCNTTAGLQRFLEIFPLEIEVLFYDHVLILLNRFSPKIFQWCNETDIF